MFRYPDQKIQPFRQAEVKDFRREDQQYFAKARYCFNLICKFICELKSSNTTTLQVQDIYSLCQLEWNVAFGAAMEYLVNFISTVSERSIARGGDLKCTSFYEYLTNVY